MTPRERATLDAIRDLTVDGVTPTYEQIRVHLGLSSKSGVHRMVESLVAQRLIRRRFGCRHNLEIVPVSGVSDTEIARMDTAALRDLAARVARTLESRSGDAA